MKYLLVLFLLLAAHSQLLFNKWTIQSNQTNIWQKYGLNMTQGFCSSILKDRSQNIQVKLYQDQTYQSFLFVKVYLNYSINEAYPFYDGLAHIQYQLNMPKSYSPTIRDAEITPYIYFFNETLTITQDNSTLVIDFKKQTVSSFVPLISIVHLALKCLLLFAMISSFRRDNSKLSFAFVYVIIGFQLQSHIFVMRLFEATPDPSMHTLGLMIGIFGWGATLSSLLYLPRPISFCESMEGLGYYMYECANGFLFSQAGNMILYALCPLLQVRFNIIKSRRDSVCPFAMVIYFINIFFFYYFKGCPACILRFPIELDVCIKATLIAIALTLLLLMQQKYGALLCVRELINGKDYKYMQQICLSEGEDMIEQVCAICLQPLNTEILLQNVHEVSGKRIGNLMKTPCNHRYHPPCLRKWMQQKNTCPLDNQPIPPCFE